MADINHRAVLLHALAKFSGQEADRDELAGGAEHKLGIEIRGLVDGRFVLEGFDGTLLVNHDRERRNSLRATKQLVALLFDRLSATDKHDLSLLLPEYFAVYGKLPDVSSQSLKAADDFLRKIAGTGKHTVRGDVQLMYEKATDGR